MRCPKCGTDDDKVIDTRASREGDSIRRRRECLHCNHRFTTYESILGSDIQVVKRDGTREEFAPDKIRKGIERACWKRHISSEQIDETMKAVCSRIEGLQQREVSSAQIGQVIMEELKKLDDVAYVRFASVYRRFKDVEEFLQEIHRLADRSGDGAKDA
ncbi:MAG: Transcriptional repressor NrdR [Lentisphaerae bacterium ADurb.BinA184]|nr:MAG: Transcriptional repressor NrdR [Lentisphaerae bacterium ADurb.BinA184]